MTTAPYQAKTIFRDALRIKAAFGEISISADTLNEQVDKQKWAPSGLIRSCISCDHFNIDGGEICNLANARPPARIIAFSCPSYSDDNDVPF